MLGLIKPVFINTDKSRIKDDAHAEDYASAERCDRVRFGRLALYYKDLGKKFCVPYDYIDRMYTKIVVCPENEFANNEQYYRLFLVHEGKEFANLIIAREESVRLIYEKIQQQNPAVLIGQEKA